MDILEGLGISQKSPFVHLKGLNSCSKVQFQLKSRNYSPFRGMAAKQPGGIKCKTKPSPAEMPMQPLDDFTVFP
jgi:hypothetical protein